MNQLEFQEWMHILDYHLRKNYISISSREVFEHAVDLYDNGLSPKEAFTIISALA